MLSKKELEFNIVQKALCGDQRAFEQLYTKYNKSLLHQIRSIVKNEEDALDITIEAFSKAFQSLHRYSPDFSFSTWLFRIGINTAIDFVRNSKNKLDGRISLDKQIMSEDSDDAPGFQLPSEDKTPDEVLMSSQRIDFIRGVIALLPRWQRRMMELRYIDNFSYDEIADELGIPLGTVKGMLHRAKEILQERVFNGKDPRYTGMYQV